MSNGILVRRHSCGKGIDYSLYENQYLTTEILTDGTITFTIPVGTSRVTDVSYRKNKGEWTTTANSSSTVVITVNVVTSDIVEWKGNAIRYGGGGAFADCSHWGGTSSFDVYGNLMSMLWNDNFIGKTEYPSAEARATQHLFSETLVVDATNLILPATTCSTHAYMCLFQNCTSLVSPPATLPLPLLTEAVYYGMFKDCTSLTSMPDILSSGLASGAKYPMNSMFSGCTSLIYNTDQTIVTQGTCYQMCQYMFSGCSSMEDAPNFIVSGGLGGDYAFSGMFMDCTNLVNPPDILNVDTVDYGMFYNMFKNCTNLDHSPIINIRNVGNNTYYAFATMFYNCSSLQDASGLNIYFPDDSEWNGEDTFDTMCYNCNTMVNSPTLNINGIVITKSRRTFYQMCYNCQNMTTHDISIDIEYDPDVVISTGSNYGNHYMFAACKKIITSPRISQPVLIKEYEYNRIFDGCILLRNVYCNFDTIVTNGINCWLNAVYSTGTVYQAGSATLPTGSISGVPSGWTLNTTDWTSQRHARMRIYLTSPGANATTSLTPTQVNEIYNTLNNTYKFDYYGDSITFDGDTYYVWENLDDPTYKLLTFTDNFYELRLQSYEFGEGYDPYTWTYGVIDSPSTLYYDNEYFEDHGWVYIKCTRL